MAVLLNGDEYRELSMEILLFRSQFPELFELGDKKISTDIFHYTDLNGLVGIVENQCFFASDIRFVNDKLELQYGLELVREVSKQIINEENKLVLTFLADNIDYYFPKNRYITCFSTNGDLLQQWQSYAQDGNGVSIGFNFPNTEIVGPRLIPRVSAVRIVYDRTEQINIIKTHIQKTLQFFKGKPYSWFEREGIEIITHFIVDSLSIAISSFKDPCFAHEKECRFFYINQGGKENKIRFRTNRKLIIPYIKIETEYRFNLNEFSKPDNDWGAMPTVLKAYKLLPIRQIYIGPNLDFEAVRGGIEILLQENGYTDVEIIKSRLPYR